MTKSKNLFIILKKIYRLIKNKYFWLCFIFILIFSSISYVFFTGNYWRWESQYYDNLRNERYKQTASNFDKRILTYEIIGNKTLKLSLKEIRDAFKKEFLKKERLQQELDFYKKNWKNEEYNIKNWKEEDIERSDNNRQKWTVEKDNKTNRYEHLLLFSVDKNKNIEKIFETTDNKPSSVSPKIDLIGLFKEKRNENKEIIGFLEVHNHPNTGREGLVFSDPDKQTEKITRDEFKEKFVDNLFFDNFIFFKGDFFGDHNHYLNNVDDIFNKEILVKCC